LLEPLNLGNVYTDGTYYERFSAGGPTITKKNTQKTERKHLSIRTWSALLVRKGIEFFKNSTNAQDRRCPCDKHLVFWKSMLDPMILEHYRKKEPVKTPII
jgi:hypothetical protein